MGWLRRKKEVEEEYPEDEVRIGRSYIDLGLLRGREAGTSRTTDGPSVRFADIDGYRQIPELSNLVYEGNILVLDFTPIANDDLELKRTITELKRVVEDINGDIAGISQNMLIITPKGIGIDKKKMKRLERKRF
ncbi:MAG: cell division protein SepF [Thermoplasmatota archaeon]